MRTIFIVVLLWSGACLTLLWFNHRFPRNRIAKRSPGELIRNETGVDALCVSSETGKVIGKILETNLYFFPRTGEILSTGIEVNRLLCGKARVFGEDKSPKNGEID